MVSRRLNSLHADGHYAVTLASPQDFFGKGPGMAPKKKALTLADIKARLMEASSSDDDAPLVPAVSTAIQKIIIETMPRHI
jgi:hypothetical protein